MGVSDELWGEWEMDARLRLFERGGSGIGEGDEAGVSDPSADCVAASVSVEGGGGELLGGL